VIQGPSSNLRPYSRAARYLALRTSDGANSPVSAPRPIVSRGDSPQEELEALQETKTEQDDYTEAMIKWYEGLNEWDKLSGITPQMAYNGAIDPNRTDIPKEIGWRIKKVLKSALKLQSKNKKVGERVLKRWF